MVYSILRAETGENTINHGGKFNGIVTTRDRATDIAVCLDLVSLVEPFLHQRLQFQRDGWGGVRSPYVRQSFKGANLRRD